MNLTIAELKEWLKIDGTDEDVTLGALIKASELLIKQSTGVIPEDVEDNPNAKSLYELIQKLIITDLYENRDSSSKISPFMISMYAQLEAYKLGDT